MNLKRKIYVEMFDETAMGVTFPDNFTIVPEHYGVKNIHAVSSMRDSTKPKYVGFINLDEKGNPESGEVFDNDSEKFMILGPEDAKKYYNDATYTAERRNTTPNMPNIMKPSSYGRYNNI